MGKARTKINMLLNKEYEKQRPHTHTRTSKPIETVSSFFFSRRREAVIAFKAHQTRVEEKKCIFLLIFFP